jgi:hypothetical protein
MSALPWLDFNRIGQSVGHAGQPAHSPSIALVVAERVGQDRSHRKRCSFEKGHSMTRITSSLPCVLGLTLYFVAASSADAQTVTVIRNVNLRPEQSTGEPPIRLLTPAEPPMELLEPHIQDGYFAVKTSAGEEGYVWSTSVRVSAAPIGVTTTFAAGTTPPLHPGVPGSASMTGCGDGLWAHVYNPTRLLVKNDCATITGTIIDNTSGQQADGVRHEADGDTHGWLHVDPQFASLINPGNTSDEGGNLVFEIVCHYAVTQTDAKPSCVGFQDHAAIPKAGTHVAIRGTFVQEQNHKKWNEIHPVSSITVQ